MTLLDPVRLTATILYIKGQDHLYLDHMEGFGHLCSALGVSDFQGSPIMTELPNICSACGETHGTCYGGSIKHICTCCCGVAKWNNRILRYFWATRMAELMLCSPQNLDAYMALALSYVRYPTWTKERYGKLTINSNEIYDYTKKVQLLQCSI